MLVRQKYGCNVYVTVCEMDGRMDGWTDHCIEGYMVQALFIFHFEAEESVDIYII